MRWPTKTWWQNAGAAIFGSLVIAACTRAIAGNVGVALAAGSAWLAVVGWAAHQRPGHGLKVVVAGERIDLIERQGGVRTVAFDDVERITLGVRSTFLHGAHHVLVVAEKNADASWTIPLTVPGTDELRTWTESQPWFDPEQWDATLLAFVHAQSNRRLRAMCAGLALQASGLVMQVSGNFIYGGITLLGCFAGFYAWARRPSRESRYIATMLDGRIDLLDPDGATSSISCDDVQEIAVEVRRHGEEDDDIDVSWIFVPHDPSQSLVAPEPATGLEVVLDWVDKLPGVDFAAHKAAMASKAGGRYVVWKRIVAA